MEIKNENLNLFLQSKFRKSADLLTEEECASVDRLPFSGKFDVPENLKIDFSILRYFPNVTSITVQNAYLTIEDLKEISKYGNIKDFSFSKCMFDDFVLNELQAAEKLELRGCFNEEYSFLSKLSKLFSLNITNPYTEVAINLSLLKENDCINELILDRCVVDHFEALTGKKIECLSLLWVELPSDYLEVINSMNSLQRLYIKDKYNSEQFQNKSMIVKNDLAEECFDFDDPIQK